LLCSTLPFAGADIDDALSLVDDVGKCWVFEAEFPIIWN
jgi:hypothetical protein